jgi:hypothetical protein
MKTRALVTMILKEAPDFSIPQILEYINEVQNIMLKRRIPFMQMIDETTGNSPVVSIVPGTKKYTINGAWFIGDVTNVDGTPMQCRIYPSNETSDAYFIVTQDFIGDVLVECYKKPQQVTSISIELTVPPDYHLNVLKEGVLAYLEQVEYGTSNRMDKFERVLIPRFIGGVSHVVTNDTDYCRKAYA